MNNIAIVGGGIVGCAIARELAMRGARVTLFERRRPGAESSSAALGLMFAHVQMEGFSPELLQVERVSLEMYPSWAQAVQDESGVCVGLRRNGFMELALDDNHAERLQARLPQERAHHVQVEWLGPELARRHEPSLSPDISGAVLYSESYAVNTPALVAAVARAAEHQGVDLRLGEDVRSAKPCPSGVRIVTAKGQEHEFHAAVIAAGAWSSALLPHEVESVRPIRGQAVMLRPAIPGLRRSVTDGKMTAVPRGEMVVVGGTTEDAGYAPTATAGGVASILTRAVRALPSLAEASIESMWGGLRPATPSGLPRIGWAGPGLLAAVGHYRSGVILAPVTATWVADLIEHKPLSVRVAAAANLFSPTEFAT